MVSPNRAAIVTWEERIAQARLACEAWKQEAEESKIKATIASQQRDEVYDHHASLFIQISHVEFFNRRLCKLPP